MSWLDFVAVLFAAGAIIEVWHKGTIFQTARAYVQAWQDVTPDDTLKGKLLELLTCPFCQSYHVPFYLFLTLLAAGYAGGILSAVVHAAVYGLAATRIGNIINYLLPERAKYKA